MSDLDDFFTVASSEPIITPSKAMRPGEQVIVTNRDGKVLHRFTASFVPDQARKVDVGDRVEYVDATGRHVAGTVFHIEVDAVTGLDVISLEEDTPIDASEVPAS